MRPHDSRPSVSLDSSAAVGGLAPVPDWAPSTGSAGVRPPVEPFVTVPSDVTATRGDDSVTAAEISV